MSLTGGISKGKDAKIVKIAIKGKLKDPARWEDFLAQLRCLGDIYGFTVRQLPGSGGAAKHKKKMPARGKKK